MSRRPKKRCAVCGQDIVPDPLVDPGNPPHRHQACTRAHPTRAHHRMVTLAKSSPSRSTPRPSPNKNATVMLSGKWLELFKEIAPNLTRIAILRDPAIAAGIGQFAAIQAMAPPSFGVELSPIDVRDAGEIERDIAAFA